MHMYILRYMRQTCKRGTKEGRKIYHYDPRGKYKYCVLFSFLHPNYSAKENEGLLHCYTYVYKLEAGLTADKITVVQFMAKRCTISSLKPTRPCLLLYE